MTCRCRLQKKPLKAIGCLLAAEALKSCINADPDSPSSNASGMIPQTPSRVLTQDESTPRQGLGVVDWSWRLKLFQAGLDVGRQVVFKSDPSTTCRIFKRDVLPERIRVEVSAFYGSYQRVFGGMRG